MSQATETAASAVAHRPNDMNLVWVDLEMTGLEPDTDRIIEVAVVVTDMHLNTIAEGPVFAIHQSDETLDKMDAWNKGTHGRSGLIERVRASTVSEEQAEAALIDGDEQWCAVAGDGLIVCSLAPGGACVEYYSKPGEPLWITGLRQTGPFALEWQGEDGAWSALAFGTCEKL